MQAVKNQSDWLDTIWTQTLTKFTAEAKRLGTKFPYVPVDHHYVDMGKTSLHWWTNGFWAGILWQLYAATGDDDFAEAAQQDVERLDGCFTKFNQLDHDVGFMWLNAAVAGYQLNHDVGLKERGLQAATLLAARYNSAGRFIRAWNGSDNTGQLIIDCLMNLPLLYWATHETGDPRFAQIATAHAETSLNTLIRPDGSVNHIAVMDPDTGEFIEALGGQGYGVGSAWARGQAWGIYGLTLAYQNTHDPKFLAKAKVVANYFIANVALSGYVSHIDFRAPQTPTYWDTTATAIASSGLLVLADCVPEAEAQFYQTNAEKMFTALTERFCDFEPDHDGLLGYGSAKYHRQSDREVPIIYGDAFYLETLLRLRGSEFGIYQP